MVQREVSSSGKSSCWRQPPSLPHTMAQQFRKEGVLFSFDGTRCTASAAGEVWFIDKQEAQTLRALFSTPNSIHRIAKEVCTKPLYM